MSLFVTQIFKWIQPMSHQVLTPYLLRYAHRYCESSDMLSVWFIKPESNKVVDYLFHELEILPREEGSGWKVKAHHLCIDDTYDVAYEFRFRGFNLEEWTLKYSVKGPSKDYSIESVYRR